nr:huntingtin-interacting protein K [Ipomoea batatas]
MEAGDEGIEIVDSKDLQQQSKAFDKLTDHVEDRQLDSSCVQTAMASIAASREAYIQAMRMREKELAAVKINAADVDIIANELEISLTSLPFTAREMGLRIDIFWINFSMFIHSITLTTLITSILNIWINEIEKVLVIYSSFLNLKLTVR